MSIGAMQRVLNLHSMGNHISDTGKLYASDVWIEPTGECLAQWIDVTDWNASMLYAWLGY